jgi:hypothetical protein
MFGGLNNDFVLWAVLAALGFSVLTLLVWGWRIIAGGNKSEEASS